MTSSNSIINNLTKESVYCITPRSTDCTACQCRGPSLHRLLLLNIRTCYWVRVSPLTIIILRVQRLTSSRQHLLTFLKPFLKGTILRSSERGVISILTTIGGGVQLHFCTWPPDFCQMYMYKNVQKCTFMFFPVWKFPG